MRTFAEKPKSTQQTTSLESTTLGRAHFGQSPEVNSILHLQRTIGNHAVLRMLEAHTRDTKGDSTITESARFGHDFSRIPVHASVPRTVQTPQTSRGARDGHAYETDGITCSTAGKLGASFIIEGPWEGMWGNGGPGTKPDAGVGGGGSGGAATPPRLSKKTVSPLTKGNCGTSDWIVQWELDKKTTKGGWVVQKVELSYDVKDCSDKAVDPTKRNGPKPHRFPFWEAWQINKNQQVTTFAEGGDVNDDSYDLVSPGSDTKGAITIKGTAEFYEGLTLPSRAKC